MMKQAMAANNSKGFNQPWVQNVALYWLVACMSNNCTKMSQAKQNLQHDGLNPKGTEECRERKPSTATHIHYTHTIRNTHHPHVSALSSCIQACWSRPRACDCVRGEFWVANSIWTEDPILRCQYSPHYLCSLLIQGRGEAHVEQKCQL